MPSSYVDSFAPIVKVLQAQQPTKVIDIGPGWGKYGLACREYLPDIEHLHALEVHQGRLATQDCIYDWVYTGDVRDPAYTARFWSRWNLALLIDVIEHMTLEEGHQLLGKILSANCAVLVSTPKLFQAQHDDHNPYEEHLSLWAWDDFFNHYRVTVDVSTVDSIIYLLAP